MQNLPHYYTVAAIGDPTGDVTLESNRLPTLPSAPPAEFGGPGDRWSPETFLVAALADCFVLTFRGVARASHISWMTLRCEVSGTLDRVDQATQFTAFEIHAHLQASPGTTSSQAQHALEKAERNCLIANSLKATVHLTTVVAIAAETASALVG